VQWHVNENSGPVRPIRAGSHVTSERIASESIGLAAGYEFVRVVFFAARGPPNFSERDVTHVTSSACMVLAATTAKAIHT
jgi:hypothetical protein